MLQLFCLCCISICGSKTITPNGSIIKNSNTNTNTNNNNNDTNCNELPLVILQRVLGPAFDARYMSVNRPLDNENHDYTDILADPDMYKRDSDDRPSFYVTDEQPQPLSDEPAWNVQWEKFHGIHKRGRRKRASAMNLMRTGLDKDLEDSIGKMERERSQQTPWRCENRVKWIDLGPDYHPSHIRTIECSKQKCYYGQFECRAKNFGVHILRRRRGACASAYNLKSYGFVGDFAEVWEWVEVAINFCCDCVVPKRSYYY